MLRTFRGGLLIGLAVAVAVAAGAITYERYDTKTLKRTVKRRPLQGFGVVALIGDRASRNRDRDRQPNQEAASKCT